jgi:site-specific DNA-cytosine methylase
VTQQAAKETPECDDPEVAGAMTTRHPRDGTHEEADEDDIPLHRKRAFGSGIKRKRVEFVRAQDIDETAAAASAQRGKASAIGDLYASVVLGGTSSSSPASKSTTATPIEDNKPPVMCPVCSLPIMGTVAQHETSLAHQVSLEHSHPPSALDRSRMGLRALEARGWDPDARRGLGLEGEGVRFPIKVPQKDDTLGIGAVVPATSEADKPEKPKALSAKEMKRQMKKQKENDEKMQRELYGRLDVEAYLKGTGGDGG